MKVAIYVLSIFLLISCNPSTQKSVSNDGKIESNQVGTIGVDINDNDLNGTWGLTNYFDTIIENKELAKYRIQTPTWFAVLLNIENDSLNSYGSIESNQYKINKINDPLIQINSGVTGEKWNLKFTKPYLILTQDPSSEKIDSTNYIFRKRNDLNYFTSENKDNYTIGNNVTEYFNSQLFEGKYINTKTQKDVIFGDAGELIGIEGFDSYEVRNYFGTLHMHKNLDVISFKNNESNEYKQYNWVFSEDELQLTEFVHEKVSYNGKTYDGDYLILGIEKITLKKQ